MRNSQLATLTVPGAGTDRPATLFVAREVPTRIVVRNTGGTPVYLAHESSTLINDGTSGILGAFQLPVDKSEVFVLAPKQGIYATSFGGGGEVSIAVSEAIPTKWMES